MLITGVTKTPENCVKVLSLLEACFDLISGSSLHMKIQIMGGKITENEKKKEQKMFDLLEQGFSCL